METPSLQEDGIYLPKFPLLMECFSSLYLDYSGVGRTPRDNPDAFGGGGWGFPTSVGFANIFLLLAEKDKVNADEMLTYISYRKAWNLEMKMRIIRRW